MKYPRSKKGYLGFEFQYSGDLKSGLVWILNGRKEFGLQMVRIADPHCIVFKSLGPSDENIEMIAPKYSPRGPKTRGPK